MQTGDRKRIKLVLSLQNKPVIINQIGNHTLVSRIQISALWSGNDSSSQGSPPWFYLSVMTASTEASEEKDENNLAWTDSSCQLPSMAILYRGKAVNHCSSFSTAYFQCQGYLEMLEREKFGHSL